MQIEITPEALLKQLKLSVSDHSLDQMNLIINNTKGSEHFFKHIFALNDALAPMNAFVAPSNSVDRLKIKYHGKDDQSIISEFHDAVHHWSDKYKVDLEKVEGKETYYIVGIAS